MDKLIDQVVKSFEPSSKKALQRYDEFLIHIYQIYGLRMTFCRSEKIKNKYIKERDGILEYAVKNKQAILKQLNK